MYVLEYHNYGDHFAAAVSEDIGALKIRAEVSEHGQRTKPRNYEWAGPGTEEWDDSVATLRSTRGAGDWVISPVDVL